MSKKRVQEDSDSDIDLSSTDEELEQPQVQTNDEEPEIVDVDFDFFDFNPEIDFHSVKNFIRQLFGDDNVDIELSALTELLLEEGHVGTTVKTDGKGGDPFSILSVLNLTKNLKQTAVSKLVDYILAKTSKSTEFNIMLRQLLKQNSKYKTGLIFSERLINMPVETVPPMYKMLLEEMEKSEDSHEEYELDYFIVVSKVYQLVASEADKLLDDSNKRKKTKTSDSSKKEMDYFHYEDTVLEENSTNYGYFNYNRKVQESDARRVFTDYGIEPKMSLILLTKAQLSKAIAEMVKQFPPF
ncbi:BA75_02997T0 [Komagataella pastoris]|uniref:Protein BCP1 n=1 Tax=Komagataella pastoris TaxID=4922 RepID=A0A1B2JAA5_PICPA|nr:BA75_02997T0 [Komagataella pastoris]